MNTDELRGLLSERATRAGAPAGDVLHDVHQTIGTLRRRRTGGVLLAVAAVATGAVLMAGTVTGSSSRSSDPVDQPGPTPSRSVRDEVPLLPAAGVALAPGSWTLLPEGDDPGVQAVVDLPEGYESGQWFIGSASEPFRAVGLWNVARVFDNGCTHRGGAVRVDTAAEVAAALEAQQLTTTTKPVPVTLDGYEGLAMTLTAPADRPGFASCKFGVLDIFNSAGGNAERYMETPGAVDHYWILDIDGDAYILDAYSDPRASDAQVEELTEIVESAKIELPGSDS